MIRGFLAGLALVLALLAGYLFFHLGVGLPVQISEEDQPSYFILFQSHRGAYFQISGQIAQVEALAQAAHVDCELTFGEFLDDPKEMDEDRLRSRGGCISRKPYEKNVDHCETSEIPPQRFVIAHFSGSPAIGPWKVYPKVQTYLAEHRLTRAGPSLEIYRLINDGIETAYLFPVK